MLNRDDVLKALRNVANVPLTSPRIGRRRMIYETWHGDFRIDYAAFPGGTSDSVPRNVIEELERDGIIVPAYADSPKARAWVLEAAFLSETRH